MKYYRYRIQSYCDHWGGVVIAENKERALDQIIDAYRENRHDIVDEDVAVWEVERDEETAELYGKHNVIECY